MRRVIILANKSPTMARGYHDQRVADRRAVRSDNITRVIGAEPIGISIPDPQDDFSNRRKHPHVYGLPFLMLTLYKEVEARNEIWLWHKSVVAS